MTFSLRNNEMKRYFLFAILAPLCIQLSADTVCYGPQYSDAWPTATDPFTEARIRNFAKNAFGDFSDEEIYLGNNIGDNTYRIASQYEQSADTSYLWNYSYDGSSMFTFSLTEDGSGDSATLNYDIIRDGHPDSEAVGFLAEEIRLFSKSNDKNDSGYIDYGVRVDQLMFTTDGVTTSLEGAEFDTRETTSSPPASTRFVYSDINLLALSVEQGDAWMLSGRYTPGLETGAVKGGNEDFTFEVLFTGKSVKAAETSPIPEPSSFLLALFGLLTFRIRREKRNN